MYKSLGGNDTGKLDKVLQNMKNLRCRLKLILSSLGVRLKNDKCFSKYTPSAFKNPKLESEDDTFLLKYRMTVLEDTQNTLNYTATSMANLTGHLSGCTVRCGKKRNKLHCPKSRRKNKSRQKSNRKEKTKKKRGLRKQKSKSR